MIRSNRQPLCVTFGISSLFEFDYILNLYVLSICFVRYHSWIVCIVPLTQVCESSPAQHFFFGSRSHLLLLVISHHIRIHFGIYSSVPEDRFSYHFFLSPKIGYRMVARLLYTGTIWYHTPTSRYPLERGGTKIKKFVGPEFTHLRETDNTVFNAALMSFFRLWSQVAASANYSGVWWMLGFAWWVSSQYRILLTVQ